MNPDYGALIHALRGPVLLITVGFLFVLNNFTRFRIHDTWPAILIVLGALSLISYGYRNQREGGPR
jgi:hypothetical protein